MRKIFRFIPAILLFLPLLILSLSVCKGTIKLVSKLKGKKMAKLA
jgi:hypothetical protein